jgi:hypothetical protein
MNIWALINPACSGRTAGNGDGVNVPVTIYSVRPCDDVKCTRPQALSTVNEMDSSAIRPQRVMAPRTGKAIAMRLIWRRNSLQYLACRMHRCRTSTYPIDPGIELQSERQDLLW